MSFRLGLTGSIGSGKSTTAKVFAEQGCAVWDADAAVHRLYAPGGLAVPAIAALCPAAVVDGAVDRGSLRDAIARRPELLLQVEAVVHPLVRADRAAFARDATADILVFDIPLLFETGSQGEFDAVVCTWIDAKEQRRRVLERGTMTEAQLDLILAKQMPADEKRKRSDYVVITDTPEHAKQQVIDIIRQIRGKPQDA